MARVETHNEKDHAGSGVDKPVKPSIVETITDKIKAGLPHKDQPAPNPKPDEPTDS